MGSLEFDPREPVGSALAQTIRHERIFEARSERPVKRIPHAFSLPPALAGHPQSGCGRADGRPGRMLAACGHRITPRPIFHQRTDVNRDVDYLFKILIYAGTAVFIFVEGILVWTLIKFRKRPGSRSRSTSTATPRSRSRGR